MTSYDDSAKTSRVTVTIPAALIAAADALARREQRSRSRVLSDALRAYLDQPARGRASGARVAAAAAMAYAPEFEAARRDRVRSDLALTPEARVLAVEELARTAALARPQAHAHQLLAFDRWEDYLAWKRTDVLR